MNSSKALAEYVADNTFDDLPEHVVKMTKLSILDVIGVMLAASIVSPCKSFERLFKEP